MTRFLLALALLVVPVALSAQSVTAPGDSTVLRPGDVLRVTIWREKDLSGEFLVDQDGRITLPLLGQIVATGTPASELRDELLERYATELRNPSIEITPLRRVYVLGEVNKPGLYTVDPTITLAGVIAVAEGATPTGNLRNIRIARNGETVTEQVAPGSTLQGVDVRSGDQIFVGRRSWFERNSTFIASAVLSLPGIVATILALTN